MRGSTTRDRVGAHGSMARGGPCESLVPCGRSGRKRSFGVPVLSWRFVTTSSSLTTCSRCISKFSAGSSPDRPDACLRRTFSYPAINQID